MVELLAPVGSKESFKAAIQNRADAVYLAGKAFGARAYADNFTNEEIKEMIEYAHLFDVKVYITINTIIYDDEFEELINFLDFIYLHDCDGIIVQDLGVAHLVRQRYPGLELHASTQMNIHSLEQVLTLKSLGFNRIVLARELSIDEIIYIKQNADIELEVFVHGALCVSYSGNCYFSSVVGKRSGNRGRCAQPCRMEYKIDGNEKFFLSTKDLNTISYIKELIEAGIDSLKIEGRMRRPEYVSQVVRSYREAIDSYYQTLPFALDYHQDQLLRIFNRSFTKGFLFKEENNNFTNIDYSNHLGVKIGKVISSKNQQIIIELTDKLSKGDSIRIVGRKTDAITVNQMYVGERCVLEAKGGQRVRLKSHINELDNAIVFLTSDVKQIEAMQKTYDQEYRTISIEGIVYLDDLHLSLKVTDGIYEVVERSENRVEHAQNITSNNRIIQQINKTANTVFRFSKLVDDLDCLVYLNIKEINEIRRNALNKLKMLRSKKYYNRMISSFTYFKKGQINEHKNYLNAKVRNEEQLKVVLNYPVKKVYVTDKKLLNYQQDYPELKFYYVVPRINKDIKPKQYESIVTSDISLVNGANTSIYMNIVNNYAINLLESLNVKTIGLSLELSINQIKNLIEKYRKINNDLPDFEVMVYGRYELMMMKYCPMSKSIGCKSCKESHNVTLVDRKGFEFSLLNEHDCTVKILNSKRLHLIDYVEMLYEYGVTNLLLDFTNETEMEVRDVCEIYFNKQDLRLEEVTYGHFKEGVL